MKIGDKIYLARMGSWNLSFALVEVVGVTPKGFVDVVFHTGNESRRFRPDGIEQGGDRYHSWAIDKMSFADRSAFLDKEKRALVAASLVNACVPRKKAGCKWDKEALEDSIRDLQAKVDAACAAVEAM